jgi:16S rRNA (adenine1518-N6/adenine1519-N6)-dimethyltransferase
VTGAPAGRESFAHYRELMAAHGFRPSRARGQNFLLDPSLHRAIADTVAVGPSDLVLEVGAGLGFLTRELAVRAGRVVAVEVDARLVTILRGELQRMADGDRVELVAGDVLDRGAGLAGPVVEAMAAARTGYERYLVVANLPYSATGPFLAAVVTSDLPPPDAMALLVQRELAVRLTATAGREAGALTKVLAAGYRTELVRTVGREVFRPRPNVDSAIVRCTAIDGSLLHGLAADARIRFAAFTRAVFAERRKKVRRAVAGACRRLGLPFPATMSDAWAERRPEQLAASELLALWHGIGGD